MRDSGRPARLLVVDDHDIARFGLVAMLRRVPGLRVVAEASDAAEALAAVQRHAPDLVLLDVRMPRVDGLETARKIRALRPATRIMMVSTWDYPEYVEEAYRAGATGYITKGASLAEVAAEVTRVLADEQPSRPPTEVAGPTRATIGDALTRIHRLTPRQRQILALVAAGLTNNQVGAQLGISGRTVQTTMERIYQTLDVPNRTQAARLWIIGEPEAERSSSPAGSAAAGAGPAVRRGRREHAARGRSALTGGRQAATSDTRRPVGRRGPTSGEHTATS